jgi:hypothetical protein
MTGGRFIVRRNPFNFWVAREAVYFDSYSEATAECDRLNAWQDDIAALEAELKRLETEIADLSQDKVWAEEVAK